MMDGRYAPDNAIVHMEWALIHKDGFLHNAPQCKVQMLSGYRDNEIFI